MKNKTRPLAGRVVARNLRSAMFAVELGDGSISTVEVLGRGDDMEIGTELQGALRSLGRTELLAKHARQEIDVVVQNFDVPESQLCEQLLFRDHAEFLRANPHLTRRAQQG